MYQTINERLEDMAKVEFRCEVVPPAPKGKAAVMQDTMLEFLTKASTFYDKTGSMPWSQFITLVTDDCRIYGNVWINGKYSRLPFSVGAKIEREFICSIRLADLKALLSISNTYVETDRKGNKKNVKCRPSRLDLTYSIDSHILEVNAGNWKSRLQGWPEQFPSDAHPIEREYTKDELSEFKWLKAGLDIKSSRPQLSCAYVANENGAPFICATNGYSLFVTMNHAKELPQGWLDIAKTGMVDENYGYFDYQAVVEKSTGQRVTVNRQEFIAAVKTAMKVTNEGYITLDFREFVLTVSGESEERGSISTPITFKQDISAHVLKFNGKLILDAVKDSKLNEVMITFNAVNNDPVRFICGKGRAAWIMPIIPRRAAQYEPETTPAVENEAVTE